VSPTHGLDDVAPRRVAYCRRIWEGGQLHLGNHSGVDSYDRVLRNRGAVYFSESALYEAARRSQGFSMAYVQEIVVNALLGSAHNGTTPSDTDLLRSLDALRLQRKCASKHIESLEEQENVGFCVPNS